VNACTGKYIAGTKFGSCTLWRSFRYKVLYCNTSRAAPIVWLILVPFRELWKTITATPTHWTVLIPQGHVTLEKLKPNRNTEHLDTKSLKRQRTRSTHRAANYHLDPIVGISSSLKAAFQPLDTKNISSRKSMGSRIVQKRVARVPESSQP